MKALRAIVRWVLWLEPCGCGCDLVRIGGGDLRQPAETRPFSELGRIAKWACRDGSSD